ncbi:hypothetical protein CCP2SC5_420035 [Azospirillaceae bacterium]
MVSACGVGWVTFDRAGQAIATMSEQTTPQIIAALSLSEQSATVAAEAPGLVSADNDAQRNTLHQSLTKQLDQIDARVEQLSAAGASNADQLRVSSRNMRDSINALNKLSSEQIQLAAHHHKLSRRADEAHKNILLALAPLIDDAVFNVVINSENVAEKTATAIKKMADEANKTAENADPAQIQRIAENIAENNRNAIASVATQDVELLKRLLDISRRRKPYVGHDRAGFKRVIDISTFLAWNESRRRRSYKKIAETHRRP